MVGDQIAVTLDPIVNLDSRELTGYELLPRWNRPGHGAVPATELIDLACSLGVDHVLQGHLFEQALGTLTKSASSAGATPITLWVPVRPHQLLHPHFASMIADGAGAAPHLRIGLTMEPTPPADSDSMAVLRELTTGGIEPRSATSGSATPT